MEVKNKLAWDQLSMQQKAELIKLGVQNGVFNIKDIRDTFNLYSSGGKKQSAVNRPRDIDEAIEISRNTPYNKNIDDVEGPGYREYMWKLAQAKSKVWGISPEEAYDSFIHPSEFNYRRWYNLASQDELDNTLTNGDAHWMDVFGKTVGADTFSNESPYSGYVNPYNPKGITGGTWTGRLGIDEYIPSESQIDNNWPLNKAWFAIDRGNKYYQEKISKGEDTHEVPSIMTYNNGVMLPEITVTPRGNYIEYSPYANGGDLVHKKAGEEQGESSYIQKQDNTNIYSLPIIDPVPVPDEMRLSDEKLVALNHAKALYANEGLEIVSPEFDLLTLARGFMTEPLGIIKGKNAAKKPLAIGAEDFTYGTKDNINKYFDNAVKSEATQLLENPRYRGLLEWPYEDIAIYRNLPDEVLDIYSEGVIPRMVEQRPWLNADDFIRDTENALLYRSPGYAVYPDKVFVKAGLDDVAGMYFPSTGQISIAEGYVQKALPHEIRHKLDDAIDLTLSENNYLQNAYGNIFSDMKGFKTSDMAKEMVTTNLDSRLKLLGRHSTSDIKIQNALIDRASDDLIFKAVEQSNSYGKKFIELLKEQGLLTPERAQYFRDAMKYVGMFSAPMVLATTTDNQKSTGGPLYPFSFEKKSFLKTPVVRYDEGGKTYTVKSGDYLGKIAQANGITIADILAVNPGLNADKINIGQVLNLPGKPNITRQQLGDYIKTYKNKGWTEKDIDYLYSKLSTTDWDPSAIVYAMATESSFNPAGKNPVTSAKGLAQITDATMRSLYGTQAGDSINNLYTQKKVSTQDAINHAFDFYNYAAKKVTSERDDMGYGRLKTNLLAPNAGRDSKVSKAVKDNSLAEEQKGWVNLNKTTYRDLAQKYDSVFNTDFYQPIILMKK